MEEGHTCSGSETQQAFYYDSTENMCKVFTYNGCGGNLNKFWSEQSCTRRCVDSDESEEVQLRPRPRRPNPRPRHRDCRRPLCHMSCPFGFVKNEQGCIVCECMKQEESNCPSSDRCGNYCPYGRQVNPRTGCERCTCQWQVQHDESSSSSSESAESESYDSDYIESIESDSAESSESSENYDSSDDEMTGHSIPDHCSGRMCAMLCQYGFERDSTGCPVCRCRRDPALVEREESRQTPQTFPEVCATRPMCMMYCREYEVDGEGCPKCSCRRDPREEQEREIVTPTESPRVVCPPFRCGKQCLSGYKRSHNGCPQCTCRDPEPTRPDEGEVELVEDSEEEGCPLRKCWRMRCRFGFASDERGCEICQCLPPPDSSRPPVPVTSSPPPPARVSSSPLPPPQYHADPCNVNTSASLDMLRTSMAARHVSVVNLRRWRVQPADV